MKRWEVWAPRAKKVEQVRVGDRVIAEPVGEGRWATTTPPIGSDYTVSLDGGPQRPDPRSRLQPSGVHGPSRWIDPHFPWTDSAFRGVPFARGVISEIHLGTFTQAAPSTARCNGSTI